MFLRILKRERKTSLKRTARSRPLGMESLEDRRVLSATNLGVIEGKVFIDSDGGGTYTAGEEVPNAQIRLFEDTNNNNSFDNGTDAQVATTTTDANGDYAFSGLETGNYFAFQPNQTPAGGVALPQQVSARTTVDGTGTQTTLIDDFVGNSGPTTDGFPAGTPVTEDFAAGTAIGGNRQFTAEFLDGTDGFDVSIRTLTERLVLETGIDARGEFTVVWDGAAGGFDPTGLGGVDLTTMNGTGFCLDDLMLDEPTGTLTLRVYTDAANFSEVVVNNIPEGVDLDFFFPFAGNGGDAQFQATGGTGADFANVGAIELVINSQEFAMDARLRNLGVFGTNTMIVDFQNDSPAPQIDVEKLTNGNQADLQADADVPIVAPGSTVTWTYLVENTGTVDIVTVNLDDDIIGSITVADRTAGDLNSDGILNPDEVWTFQRTGTAITGFYTNQARVEGFATSGLSDTDTDTSNYRGAMAAIDIEKSTNGSQADLATDVDVPNINVGNAITWTYVVQNTGSIELTNVQVTDSVEGIVATITDMGNGDATLDVNESWTYTLTGTAQEGAYENFGTVTADPVGIATGQVTNTDFSHYFGVQSGIDIEKATNNIDADAVDTGPTVNVGDTVTFTYVVTNSGNTPISNVVVVDDAGTPGNPADDFNPTFVDGDADADNQLDTTEQWRYRATRIATLGPYRNNSTVTGQSAAGTTLQSFDPSNHRGQTPPEPISKRSLLASAFR